MSPSPPTSAGPTGLRAVIMALVGTAIFLAMVFGPAGTFAWAHGWIYVGVVTVGWWSNVAVLRRRNPDLLNRRARAGEGTPEWDRRLLHLVRLAVLAVFIVAGLDAVRYAWSSLPCWSWGAGLALHVGGYSLVLWSMVVNRHFEGTVRVQEDQGHRVCDQGPYGRVRHPGYVGFSLLLVAIPLLLGSAWAFVPAGLSVALLVARTAREDRFLREELAGYADYARRVRHRLLPGVW